MVVENGESPSVRSKAFMECAVPGPRGEPSGPRSLSAKQEIALIDKYMKDSPDKWSDPLFAVVSRVLYDACKR